MQTLVIKRNGKEVDFDKQRIVRAIEKAMKYGSGIYSYQIAVDIAKEIYEECEEKQTDKI